MKSEERNNVSKKRKRFLIVLPILVVPFITMAFWAMGGGVTSNASGQLGKAGLKTELPDANLKDEKDLSKLGFYERADKSVANEKRRQEMDQMAFGNAAAERDTMPSQLEYNSSSFGLQTQKDPNEEKVYQKLAQINAQLVQSPVPQSKARRTEAQSPMIASSDVDRLEAMLGMTGGTGGDDPEMARIDSVMEKILDIQHPERVKAQAVERKPSTKTISIMVEKKTSSENISLLDTIPFTPEESAHDFFSYGSEVRIGSSNAIRAVVSEGRSLVSGAILKLRLLDDITLEGTVIPKENFVFGIVSLSAERLKVDITSVRYGNSLFPVKLTVYDLDGIEGIFIPDAISRQVARNSVDGTAQMLDIATYDPSLKAQAVSAGIGTAKTLLSKKVKLVKAFVKTGYQVLLVNNGSTN